jgi:hypothetical protein
MNAEEHLESVGLGGTRQPTLLYLRQAGAVSPKLDATEAFLNKSSLCSPLTLRRDPTGLQLCQLHL